MWVANVAQDPTDPNQDGKPAGTFQDALDAKTDAEWERGFLRKQRYWLACCSFCKLCCLSFWTFIPVMLVLIKDFRCEITGPGCLATTMCHGHDDGMSTLNQFVGLSIDQIQIVNFRGSVDIIADMNQTGLGGVSLQGDPVDMAGLACTCDVDLENPNNVGCRGQAPVGETDKVCMP